MPVLDELRKGRLFKQVEAKKRAATIAHERQEQTYHKQGGRMTAMIPPESFHYWGQRLGYECWDDPAFVREFIRDNPECRVIARSANASVGWTPEIDKRKFHKSYGEI